MATTAHKRTEKENSMVQKKADEDEGQKSATTLTITPPNIQKLSIRIKGTSPYVQNKFSAKAKAEIEEAPRGQHLQEGREEEAS